MDNSYNVKLHCLSEKGNILWIISIFIYLMSQKCLFCELKVSILSFLSFPKFSFVRETLCSQTLFED